METFTSRAAVNAGRYVADPVPSRHIESTALMNNPIFMGIVTGVVSFVASAITSYFARGDFNLVPALVGGVAFGFTFGVIIQWQQSKKSPSKTESNDSQ